MGKKALIITWQGYQDHELIYPFYRLQEADFEVDIMAAYPGEIHGILGTKMVATKSVYDIKVDDYDLLVIPGGVKALEKVRQEKQVLDFIKEWNEKNKIIASICHGAQLLISSKVVNGRKISGYYSIKDDIINAGAEYVDAPFVIDQNIISCPHYKYIGKWMAEALALFNSQGDKKESNFNFPKAVLFDLDGVLARTIEDHFFAWKKVFQEYGINLQREDYFPLEGMKMKKIAETLSVKYNIIENPERIVEKKVEYYLRNHSFSLYPKAEELIDFLKEKGFFLAIVTASSRKQLDYTVPKEFLNKFNTVISGDDTERGKPDPEPYLNAIRKLNLQPKECIAIENAPLGISSAKNAGVYCLAIPSTLNKEYLSEADEIKDIENLKDWFNNYS